MPRKYKQNDYIGKRINGWYIISFLPYEKKKNVKVVCICPKCGKETSKILTDIKNGYTRSCGCEKLLKLMSRSTKHGYSKTRLYRVYHGMVDRCCDVNNKSYKDYGGRGITICDQWLNEKISFFEWACNNGYTDDLTIERKNVNGNYEPSNCTFIPNEEQALNRRTRIDNKSGHIGISKRNKSGKWIVRVTINKKRIYLGEYELLKDAVSAKETAENQFNEINAVAFPM